jgi:hydroxymethylglutaryl-CoA lyase
MKEPHFIHITETPRDAIQGWNQIIPLKQKVEYINTLLKVGFDKVDVGSFVSPKAVPQMADTVEMLSMLNTRGSSSKIMVIVGNKRGGLEAAEQSKVQVIGYPYSISSTFLQRNLNTTPNKAWDTIKELQSICLESGKHLQVYITMAFGDPYHDNWNDELVLLETKKLDELGIKQLAFSDITGEGSADSIGRLCSKLTHMLPNEGLSIHLHTKSDDWQPKVEAAWQAGFRNFEGALGGFGGCPMTGYELLGNLDTAQLVAWCNQKQIQTGLMQEELIKSMQIARKIFV